MITGSLPYPGKNIDMPYQGTLTERDGSVQLTSSLRQDIWEKRKIYFQQEKQLI
jgi:hypothetical protein